ncbi:hypothetical protein PSAC2689_130142 [Paraburkholderia sacchari]
MLLGSTPRSWALTGSIVRLRASAVEMGFMPIYQLNCGKQQDYETLATIPSNKQPVPGFRHKLLWVPYTRGVMRTITGQRRACRRVAMGRPP